MAEWENKVEQMAEEIREFKLMKYDVNARAASHGRVAEAYDEKQRKDELNKFMKYVEDYPGGLKGSTPEEDPQSYSDYISKGMPHFLQQKFYHNALLKIEEDPKLRKQMSDQSTTSQSRSTNNSDYFSQNNENLMPEREPDLGGVGGMDFIV